MQQIVIRLAIVFTFYIVGAYATTDILRLLKGSSFAVSSRDCFCPICKSRIRLIDQVPIIAYIKNQGKCRSCGSKIPESEFLLEIFLFCILTAISFVFQFRMTAFAGCLLVYEVTKMAYLIKYGKRTDCFCKNLILSLLNNMLIFGLIFVLFVIAQL